MKNIHKFLITVAAILVLFAVLFSIDTIHKSIRDADNDCDECQGLKEK